MHGLTVSSLHTSSERLPAEQCKAWLAGVKAAVCRRAQLFWTASNAEHGTEHTGNVCAHSGVAGSVHCSLCQ